MFRNQLLTAWRNFRKSKFFSLINVLGLSLGLTCCLLITMWIKDELSFDRFHKDAGRIFRLTVDINWEGNQLSTEGLPMPLGPALQQNYPSVASIVRISEPRKTLIRHGEKRLFAEKLYHVDSTFLSVFTFPVLYGDSKTALSGPDGLVLTRSLAEKLFDSAGDAIGKVVKVQDGMPRTVKAVIADVPPNSHLQFDALSPLPAFHKYSKEFANWGNFNYPTYLLLRDETAAAALQARMGEFYKQVFGPALGNEDNPNVTFKLHLQPLTHIHFGSTHLRGHENGATMAYVYAFSGVALFMLVIACINYMNLATARSLKRAREVGVRKALGSGRRQLIGQYLTESMLTTLISVVISLTLVQVATPLFNHITGKNVSIFSFLDGQALLLLGAVTLFTGLVSGSYPAFVLSGYRPVEVLKGNPGTQPKGLWIRRGLVVFQFAISVFMTIGTIVVYQQLQFMKDNHAGFDHEQVLTVKLQGSELPEKAGLLKDRLLSHAQVAGVTFASSAIGEERTSSTQFLFHVEGQDRSVQCDNMLVEYDYLPVLNISLKEGRNFNQDNSTDTDGVLINETLARRLGAKSPVGMEVSADRKLRILGVVKDFHLNSLHNSIQPLLLRLSPQKGNHLYVRVQTKDIAAARAAIDREYARLQTDYPLELGFLDQTFAMQYAEDERKNTLFLTFASITIFIACMGLFGLAAYSMEQRTKEIGIRKVLGAPVPGLVNLLSRDFLLLVLIANLLAWPLAWFGLQKWLQEFPYQVELTGWVFLTAGLLSAGVALLTVCFQTLKAARANPVTSLRSE
jgi:putative ABC transport system permease protein